MSADWTKQDAEIRLRFPISDETWEWAMKQTFGDGKKAYELILHRQIQPDREV